MFQKIILNRSKPEVKFVDLVGEGKELNFNTLFRANCKIYWTGARQFIFQTKKEQFLRPILRKNA